MRLYFFDYVLGHLLAGCLLLQDLDLQKSWPPKRDIETVGMPANKRLVSSAEEIGARRLLPGASLGLIAFLGAL